VPAHYHASLGAVTAAFMAAAYLVAGPAGAADGWRAPRWQIALYGVGQVIFALGFAIGGAHGLGRKEYAAEQHVRSVGEYAGLIVMGLGGLVAVAGGVWFLVLIVRQMARWRRGPVAS
jgi:heme/copper-type cytochrome/quinol oxidase subunit 1